MNNIDEQIEHFFGKKKRQFSFDNLIELVSEHMMNEARKYDIVAGQQIRKGKMPVNMGNTAEGIFAIGLTAAMNKGTPISKEDIIEAIAFMYDEYVKNLGTDQFIIEHILPNTKNFQSHFSAPINVNFKIALNTADMVTLFMPLDIMLPDTVSAISSTHEPLLNHLLYLKSGNTDGWAVLAAILLDESIDEIEREKALVLLNSKHRPVVNHFKKIANGVASFWNQKGGGKRGYEDIVADTVAQLNSDDLSKTVGDTGTTISVVADGVSANLATTADAYIKIGDDVTGELLFSYSLKAGSNQIFQTGSPGSERQTKKSGAVGGGIKYMFLKFGLPVDQMPTEANKFYSCVDSIYSKPQSNPGDECGAAPSKERALEPEAIQTHIDVWNDTTMVFANLLNEKLREEKYKVEMLGGLAIMITKTKEELDMEYVNLGSNAESTIRAFPGLITKYAKHFEFNSAKMRTGNVLEEYGSYTANQPAVYTSKSNPIQKNNLCLSKEDRECPEEMFEVKVSEIKKLLSRGSEYLIDFFDADSVEKIFDVIPEMRIAFNSIVEKKTKKAKTTAAVEKAKAFAFEKVFNDYIDPNTAQQLVNEMLTDDDVLEMVMHKLNTMLPLPDEDVFKIRVKARISSSGGHSWRTILEKGHGLTNIMSFVKYAKYLKYEAGDAVLQEVEDILDASVRTLEREEQKLK